jgi:hypothetical protein
MNVKQQERYPEVNSSYPPAFLAEAENQPGVNSVRETPVPWACEARVS